VNRISIALVSVVIPVLFAAVGVGLQLAWLPELPSEIATHWNLAGDPDAFGPSWTMPLMLGVLGLALPAVFGTILARTVGQDGPTATQKLLAVASLFAVTLLSITVTASVAIQREGTGQAQIGPTLLVAVATGLALAVVAWFVLPRAVEGRAAADPVAPVPVAPGERVAWVGHARFEPWVLALLAGVVVLVTGAVAFAVAATGTWPIAIVPFVIAAALLGTASWKVRVDSAGLTVRGTLGWPVYRVPLAQVESAGTTEVVPLGEFGGYGVRWGLGRRLGVITRGGEALEVKRRDGRAVIVTVDDAATAAGLLTTLAARSATG
jgi:hypothetical protein